jgi:type IV pilus assembly protein PilX
MSSSTFTPPGHRQDGFVLLVCLTFLVVLTLLGIGAMKVSSMQERMAGNAMDRALAFQAAERTLREAEGLLIGTSPYAFNGACSNGLCAAGVSPLFSDDSAWGGSKDVAAVTVLSASADANSKLSASPRWRGEFAGQVKCSTCAGGWASAYRITVRSQGQSADTRVFLQSVYVQK